MNSYEEKQEKVYFEDLQLNEITIKGDYLLTEEELITFARKWDPQVFHLDKEAAEASVFGGLSACSAHNFSIMARLLFNEDKKVQVLAGLGTESMKFLNPSRPGDRLKVSHQIVEKRASKSRPNAGIVKNRTQLLNQNDEIIMDAMASALVAKRPV